MSGVAAIQLCRTVSNILINMTQKTGLLFREKNYPIQETTNSPYTDIGQICNPIHLKSHS